MQENEIEGDSSEEYGSANCQMWFCQGDEYRNGWPSVGGGGSFQVPTVTVDGSRRSRGISTAESFEGELRTGSGENRFEGSTMSLW